MSEQASRDWHTRALVRILETTRKGSVDPWRERTFNAGDEVEMLQWGRAGDEVDRSAWWTSYDIDGAFIIESDKVEVVRIIDEVSPVAESEASKEWYEETPQEFVAGFTEEVQVHHTLPGDTVHTLVASTNRGRYALDDPEHGQDVTSGQSLEIFLDGRWLVGNVEHDQNIYTNQGLQELFERPQGPHTIGGYYFIARNGGVCGLCVGMKVKLL